MLLIAGVLALAPLLLLEVVAGVPGGAALALQVLWGTLCFIVLPVIHALCRMVVWLEGRLDERAASEPKRKRRNAA